jgi:SAM-dependent methyltransferase
MSIWVIKELGKLGLNAFQAVKVASLRGLGIIDFPVPPNSNMRRTSARTLRHYAFSSWTTAAPIITAAELYGYHFDEGTNVLDFGCGSGSQLMTMTKYRGKPNYHSCDVDPSAIAFVKKSYPGVDAKVSKFAPPLPFADGQMDLIYTVSTFSHFTRDDVDVWLKELRRLLRPGGLLLATVEGKTALDVFCKEISIDPSEVQAKLRAEGFFYKEYDWLEGLRQRRALSKSVDTATYFTGSYGSTVMTPGFIRENWPQAGYEILGIAEGVACMRQDLIVLRRV